MKTLPNPQELKCRWTEVSGFNIRDSLTTLTSPFGKTADGYLDLRGVTINDSLHKLRFARVDFSYCMLDLGQFVSEVTDCRFFHSTLLSFLGLRFDNCSFAKAKMTESSMQGEYHSCCFDEANLMKRTASKVHFVACSFNNSDLRKGEFYDCSFERCVFRDCKLGQGSFGGSVFTDCIIEGLDFSTTVMERVKGLK